VSADTERARDGAPAHSLSRQQDDLMDQLLPRPPARRHPASGEGSFVSTPAIVHASARRTPPSSPRLSRTSSEAPGPRAVSGVVTRQDSRRPALLRIAVMSSAIVSTTLREAPTRA